MQVLWTRRGWLAAAFSLAVTQPALAAPPHRIIAVGDLHGDFAAWQEITRAAALVDADGRWIGGSTILVQTGDVVDRGPDSLKIIEDLMRLQRLASSQGGKIVALVGNHEAMNMTGDLRYLAASDFAAFVDNRSPQRRESVYTANMPAIVKAYRQRDPDMSEAAIRQAWLAANPLGSVEHAIAWRPDGRIGQWIIANPAITMIDGNLFVHGGISPAYAHMSISEINRKVRAALTAQTTDPKAIINDPLGPLWYRGLAMNDNAARPDQAAVSPDTGSAGPSVESQLADLLAAFGANRIIIGHTPVLSGVAIRYGGRLIQIDTGITSVYGGKVSYLELQDNVPVPHVLERSSHP